MTNPMNRDEAVQRLDALRSAFGAFGSGKENLADIEALKFALTALRSGGGEGESSAEWKAGFAAGCDGVMSPAYGLATDLHELEERLRSLKPQQDVVGGPEQYGFMRGIEAARDEVRRTARALPHPQPARGEAVAWARQSGDPNDDAFVISAKVKRLWLASNPKRVARYTRPLYTTHVPCWALPAVESALSMLDLQGYWHSDLAAFRDWLKEKSQ